MAESLHKRKCITHMMNLLDQLVTVEKCVNLVNELTSVTPLRNKVRQIVNQASGAIDNIKQLAGEISDKRTILAHQQMALEDQRPIELGKSAPRSSNRHANNCRKRKLSELDSSTLKSTLMDLRQSGRLTTPKELCKIIHGDDSKEHKQKRTAIYKILCDDFQITKTKNMRNIYSIYRKFLLEGGPAPPTRFGCRRPPLMTSKEFLDKVQEKVHTDEHKEKELRQITEEVLGEAKKKRLKKKKISPLMYRGPGSVSSVDKYMRIATASNVMTHKGTTKHSTNARDTAIRSFRHVVLQPS